MKTAHRQGDIKPPLPASILFYCGMLELEAFFGKQIIRSRLWLGERRGPEVPLGLCSAGQQSLLMPGFHFPLCFSVQLGSNKYGGVLSQRLTGQAWSQAHAARTARTATCCSTGSVSTSGSLQSHSCAADAVGDTSSPLASSLPSVEMK